MYHSTAIRSTIGPMRSSLALRPPPSQALNRCLFSTSRTSLNKVVVDQTKKDNDPQKDQTDEHKRDSKQPQMGDARYHEGIDADPEEPTDAATGIKTEGQGTPAGKGERRKVHTETREQPGPHMTWGAK